MSDLTILVAIAENGVIGRDNALPWQLSSDLKRFKADTMGKPVIMGRKTFESIGKPLPGRPNIVVTRNRDWHAEGVETAGSVDEAVRLAETRLGDKNEVCVIGGGEIYAQALPMADRLRVTHVEARPEGDTRFPEIDPDIWRSVSSETVSAGEKDSHATRHVVYERKRQT